MNRRAFVSVCLFLTMCGKETAEIQRNQSPADAAALEAAPGPTFTFEPQAVGAAVSQLFTITNKGKRPATEMASAFYLSITFKYEGGYPGVDGTCATNLNPGESCQVRVTFSPQYVSDFEQTLRFSFFDGYTTKLSDYPILRGRGF